MSTPNKNSGKNSQKSEMDRMRESIADMLGSLGATGAVFLDENDEVMDTIDANAPDTVEFYPTAAGPIYPGDTVEVWFHDSRPGNTAPISEGVGRLVAAFPDDPEEGEGAFGLQIKYVNNDSPEKVDGIFESEGIHCMVDRGEWFHRTLTKVDPAIYDQRLSDCLTAWDNHCKTNGLSHRGNYIPKQAFVVLCKSTKNSNGQNSLKPALYYLTDWDTSTGTRTCTLKTTNGLKTREVEISEVDPGYYLRPAVNSDLPGYQ